MECRIETDPERLREYLMDESRMSGHGEEAAFPADTGQIAVYLKSSGQVSVTVQGARTGLNGGAVPEGGRMINLEDCKQVLGMVHNQAKDQYNLRVQPGITLAELNDQIRVKSFDTTGWDQQSLSVYQVFQKDGPFFFSPDPTETTASIGGMISCNASGACSYHYGAVRKYVNRLTVVLSDGQVIDLERGQYTAVDGAFDIILNGRNYQFELPEYRFGGCKNAVGYYAADDMDLVDLFIGAEGTLGIIAEAWVTLIRRPQHCWGILSYYRDYQEMQSFLRFLRAVPDGGDGYIAAIEFFDSRALGLIWENAYQREQYRQIPVMERDYFAALYYEIHADSEAKALALLEQSFEQLSACTAYAEEAVAAMSDSELQRLKAFRHAAPECANLIIDQYRHSDSSLSAIFTDIATPETECFPMLSRYAKSMEQLQIGYIIYGHIGDWHLHVNMLPASAEQYRRCMELYDQWAAYAAGRGGTISAEHGVGRLKAGMTGYMISAADMERCRIIKELFDPDGRLNQGVIFK